ncbi:hypothetical protein ASE01_23295 [Nocardioides sp. Root190]|uniref:DUF6234 family protein n=1 Tax=Nocardioides sp. Root190 TaxID=1736488 RepID=UPI0006F9326B|nr:DUF6234 family protein [Nocardioides sp. Root190]KRB79654.1 hypothetical protein ASE01_23295 [Nocardioides sp. Root190]
MPSALVRRPAGAAEASASIAAILLTFAVAWHGFGVYFCLGAHCSGPSDQEILTYRLLAGALGVAVLASLALAARRRATLAFVWHLAVTALAAAVALLFAVPQIDFRELTEPEPPAENPSYVPCHSGSNDCVGG